MYRSFQWYLISTGQTHKRILKLIFLTTLADQLNIELALPRQCNKQKHRNNPGSSNLEDYFHQAIFIPYLDSIINSLKCRFSESNSTQFNLFSLHPIQTNNLNRQKYVEKMNVIKNTYNIENFENEAMMWNDTCSISENLELCNLDFLDLLSKTSLFPVILHAI